jgi:hypothetical protein
MGSLGIPSTNTTAPAILSSFDLYRRREFIGGESVESAVGLQIDLRVCTMDASARSSDYSQVTSCRSGAYDIK